MGILEHWLGYNAKRQRLYNKAPTGALKDFLAVPFPQPSTPFAQVPILAVDFETTGLNAVDDKLLSVGYVALQNRQIQLAQSYHQVINTGQKLKTDNVLIHRITDNLQAQGHPLEVVVEQLLKALTGKVMLVHFARIERHFLQQACLELYGLAPIFPIIDTLALAKKRLDMQDVAYDPSELRLANLRKKYQLPNHLAHNALNDAIATAELLLAQISYIPTENLQLKTLLC
ncbi:MAG: DNA polymerase III subunit epsilon [Gammaproteobacteria bacterium]|nr:MAG: DNA polymerase III subunit epsilon [Gammaproteobacteria bacterium]